MKIYSTIAKKLALGALFAVMAFSLAFTASAYTFTSPTLKQGVKAKTAVMELQKVLNADLGLSLTVDGAFGPMTKTAVKTFQAKHGLTADGVAGPKTMVVLNTISVGGVNNPVIPITGAVSVSAPAADMPASTVIATGSANNPVLKFTISNGTSAAVNVTGLSLTKTGFYQNTNISGVSVYDSKGVRHGNVVTTLGANGIALMTFVADPIMIGAGQSETVLVRANIAGSPNTSTGTVGFNVASAADVKLSSGTAMGSFPVVGNQMSVVNGTNSLASVTVDEMPLNVGGVQLNADPASSQEISKFQVTNNSSNEDVNLYGLTLWNNGNAAPTDYKDVQLVDQTGTVIATSQPVGQSVMFSFATPYLIAKGQAKNFTVRATLINGASRTIQFVIYSDYDVNVKGVSTMASILPTAGSSDPNFPIGDCTGWNGTTCASALYNKVTVASGNLVFTRASDTPSSSTTPGSSDVVLAKYNAKPIGEDMELRQVSFGLDQNTSAVALTGTVYIKVNDAIVYSAAASAFNVNGAVQTVTLSSYPILKAGTDNKIEVVVSVSSSATSADAYFVNSFDILLVKMLLSNTIVDPAVAVSTGLTRGVQAASLVVTTLGTPVAASTVAGTTSFHVASFEMNAGASGEDIRISSITVTDTIVGGAYTNLANLTMKDSAGNILTTSSSTAVNANTVAFNFTNPIVVTRTQPVTLKLYADVVAGTSGSHTFKIASANVTATGQSTGNSVTGGSLVISGTGQTMTLVAGGTLNAAVTSGTGSTPNVAQTATINTKDATYLAFRFSSLYEAQKITTLKLKATGTALTQPTNIQNIRLYAQSGVGALLGTTMPFATASQLASCAGNVCSYTWTTGDNILPMTINPGTPVTVFVKADIAGENTAVLGEDFYMSVTNDGTDVVAKGAVSGSAPTYDNTVVNTSGSATTIVPFSVTVSADGGYPTSGSSVTTTVAATTTLARFKVSNSGSAAITLTNVKLTDSGTNSLTVAGNDTYKLWYSSENSSDFQTNNAGLKDPAAGVSNWTGLTISIGGGSYRYLTVTLNDSTGMATSDSWNFYVAALGDLKYTVTEANLGYDGEHDGDYNGSITALPADGKPVLGTVIKS